MTGSNARKIMTEEKKITMTVRAKRNPLVLQKLAGAAMLIFISAGLSAGGGASAAIILTPMSLAAVFSKKKLMDFDIF